MQDAGHYAFLDQPQVFLDNLHRICTNYLRSGTPQVCSRGHVDADCYSNSYILHSCVIKNTHVCHRLSCSSTPSEDEPVEKAVLTL
jgi:hypothetical protein